jgi:short-subunit dehydrogenase
MVVNRQMQTVLITGASSGIGKVTCLYLAEKGYNVIGTSRSSSRLSDLYSEADQRGVTVYGLELDINSDSEVRRVMPEVFNQYGDIHALVNNAGYGLWGPIESLYMDEMKTQFETNVFAVLRMTQAVLPGMIERRSGKIINISSVLGRLGTPFNGAYASSKFRPSAFMSLSWNRVCSRPNSSATRFILRGPTILIWPTAHTSSGTTLVIGPSTRCLQTRSKWRKSSTRLSDRVDRL